MTPTKIAFYACNRNAARYRSDPSYIYRCESLGGALTAGGCAVSYGHVTDGLATSPVDVAVFHRPRATWRLRYVLWRLRRYGVTTVADFDDLVFDADYAEFSPAVLNGYSSLRSAQRLFRSHQTTLGWFDSFTVSTEPLAAQLRRQRPDAAVDILPNAVHHSWRNPGDVPSPRHRPPFITYLPGTRSHDRDFATVAPAFERFLALHHEARLLITGPLAVRLTARPGQIVQRAKTPFDVYHARVREGWVNIAPLEPTPFTQCKSALKVMEAGYWNIPTLCTPTPDTDRFLNAGALSSDNVDAWIEQLEALLDPQYYAAVCRNLRDRVLQVADINALSGRFLEFVGTTP